MSSFKHFTMIAASLASTVMIGGCISTSKEVQQHQQILSFADFPRLCRAVAEDGYLPRSLANRGRRLVYSEGIWLLTILSGTLLVLYDGVSTG